MASSPLHYAWSEASPRATVVFILASIHIMHRGARAGRASHFCFFHFKTVEMSE